MRYLTIGLRAVLVLLSLAAGLAKLLSTQAEVEFFASAGLAENWLLPLGAIQVLGAALAVFPRTIKMGLAVIGVGFLISSVVIFMTGNASFGLVSLLPVALTVVAWRLESN